MGRLSRSDHKEMKMFCMRREHREWLIERHKFYVDQSMSRVIRRLDDIDNEPLRFKRGYVRLSRFAFLVIVLIILWPLKWRL